MGNYTRPKIHDLQVDYDQNRISFVSEGQINDIKEWCNQHANLGGIFPYWEEYETRDQKSFEFDDGLYPTCLEANIYFNLDSSFSIAHSFFSNVSQPSDNLTEFEVTHTSLDSQGSVRTRFYISENDGELHIFTMKGVEELNVVYPHIPIEKVLVLIEHTLTGNGVLKANKERSECMCHDAYMIRLFDGMEETSRYIWGYRAVPGFCGLTACTADLDGDQEDEIIIYYPPETLLILSDSELEGEGFSIFERADEFREKRLPLPEGPEDPEETQQETLRQSLDDEIGASF